MIKVIYGKKGAGKTKVMIDTANGLAVNGSGSVVFIDDSNQLMYDLKHEVRFINVTEFPVRSAEAFLGFLCGLVSGNYDIESVFIDGLTYIIKDRIEGLEEFFKVMNELTVKFNISFYVSINGDPDTVPEFIKAYINA